MHSMLKRKRIQQKNQSLTSLHVPITNFEFKPTQKNENASKQLLQIKTKKMKKSQNVPIKIIRNSSLPHLNRSQSSQKFSFTTRKRGLNTLRYKSKDQIGHNKIKGNIKLNLTIFKDTKKVKLAQDQKENVEKDKNYFPDRKGDLIDRYQRKIKCSKTCYSFDKKNILELRSNEDSGWNTEGNKQSGDLKVRCQKRLTYYENKQNSQSLGVEGQKPKWQLFQFGIGTERKFTIRRTGRRTPK